MKRYQINIVSIFLMCAWSISYAQHAFNHLTVLTGPIGYQGEGWGGHPGVNRSLITGLSSLEIPFNFNPRSVDQVGDVVLVLTDIYALQQAIEWKKNGRISLLLAGPNLMVRACEHNGILASAEIDWVVVPSEWVKKAYIEDVPALKNRILVWYAGLNADEWVPSLTKAPSRDVIIYWKAQQEGERFYRQIERAVRRSGWNPIRINYGNYNQQHFKNLLSHAAFAVFVSRSESQGIALAESWAMDVPTLVWNPKELHAHGRSYSTVSACPYLSAAAGRDWQTISDLQTILADIKNILPAFKPRAWLLKNMTDTVAVQKLVNFIDSVFKAR